MTLPRSLTVKRTDVSLHAVADRLERAGLLERAVLEDVLLNGVTDDSRAVLPGDLFCAWRGTTSAKTKRPPART